jgi:hypothetical protein
MVLGIPHQGGGKLPVDGLWLNYNTELELENQEA